MFEKSQNLGESLPQKSEAEIREQERVVQEAVQRIRNKTIEAMKGKEIAMHNYREGGETMVTIPEKPSFDRDGNMFVKEKGLTHSVTMPLQVLFRTEEARNFTEQFLSEDNSLSPEAESKVRKKLIPPL